MVCPPPVLGVSTNGEVLGGQAQMRWECKPGHCGQWSCTHHVWISELPWGPLTAPNSRAQSRTQRTIQAAMLQWTHRNTSGRSRLFVWLAGLPGTLNWPVSLSHPQDKVCFRSRARPFQDLRSGFHSISIWNKIPRWISPHPVLGEDSTFQDRLVSCLFLLSVSQDTALTRTLLHTLPELSSKNLSSSHNHSEQLAKPTAQGALEVSVWPRNGWSSGWPRLLTLRMYFY